MRRLALLPLLLGLACARPQPAPADVATAADSAAELPAAPADVGAETAGCAAEQVACGDQCLPPCPLQASRDPASACLCADLAPLPAPVWPTVAERLGISVVLPAGDQPKAKAFRQFFHDEADRIGLRVVRSDLRWDDVEPQPGQFQWAATDAIVAEHLARQRHVIALLAYGNPWASAQGKATGDPYYPPDDPQDFAKYAAAVAARYPGIRDFEIWNEQNAGYRFWKNDGGVSGVPADYAALLQATYAAIKLQRPDARVAFGGLFYLPQLILGAEAFTTQAFAAAPDLGAAFDAFAYHPYALYPPTNPPEHQTPPGSAGFQHHAVDETARRLRQLLGQHQASDKALWITELGWPTEEAISELDHARFLVRAWVLALSEDVEVLCWYTFMDQSPEHQNVPWEKVFGLYRWDGDVTDGTLPQPKPAAIAHETLAKVLGPTGWVADFAGRTTARRHHVFAEPGGARVVHVLWDETVAEGQTIAAHFPARPGRAYRTVLATAPPPDEAKLPLVAPDADNLVQVQVGRTPLYVVETPLP